MRMSTPQQTDLYRAYLDSLPRDAQDLGVARTKDRQLVSPFAWEWRVNDGNTPPFPQRALYVRDSQVESLPGGAKVENSWLNTCKPVRNLDLLNPIPDLQDDSMQISMYGVGYNYAEYFSNYIQNVFRQTEETGIDYPEESRIYSDYLTEQLAAKYGLKPSIGRLEMSDVPENAEQLLTYHRRRVREATDAPVERLLKEAGKGYLVDLLKGVRKSGDEAKDYEDLIEFEVQVFEDLAQAKSARLKEEYGLDVTEYERAVLDELALLEQIRTSARKTSRLYPQIVSAIARRVMDAESKLDDVLYADWLTKSEWDVLGDLAAEEVKAHAKAVQVDSAQAQQIRDALKDNLKKRPANDAQGPEPKRSSPRAASPPAAPAAAPAVAPAAVQVVSAAPPALIPSSPAPIASQTSVLSANTLGMFVSAPSIATPAASVVSAVSSMSVSQPSVGISGTMIRQPSPDKYFGTMTPSERKDAVDQFQKANDFHLRDSKYQFVYNFSEDEKEKDVLFSQFKTTSLPRVSYFVAPTQRERLKSLPKTEEGFEQFREMVQEWKRIAGQKRSRTPPPQQGLSGGGPTNIKIQAALDDEERYKQKYANAKAAAEELRKELQKLTANTEAYKETKSKLEASEKQAQQHLEEAEIARQKAQDLERMVEQLKKDEEDSKAKIAQLRKQEQETSDKYDRLMKEVAKLEKEVQNLGQANQESQTVISNLVAKKQSLEEQVTDLENQVNVLQNTRDALAYLAGTYRKQAQDNEKYKEIAETLSIKLMEAKKEIDSFSQKTNGLKKRVRDVAFPETPYTTPAKSKRLDTMAAAISAQTPSASPNVFGSAPPSPQLLAGASPERSVRATPAVVPRRLSFSDAAGSASVADSEDEEKAPQSVGALAEAFQAVSRGMTQEQAIEKAKEDIVRSLWTMSTMDIAYKKKKRDEEVKKTLNTFDPTYHTAVQKAIDEVVKVVLKQANLVNSEARVIDQLAENKDPVLKRALRDLIAVRRGFKQKTEAEIKDLFQALKRSGSFTRVQLAQVPGNNKKLKKAFEEANFEDE